MSTTEPTEKPQWYNRRGIRVIILLAFVVAVLALVLVIVLYILWGTGYLGSSSTPTPPAAPSYWNFLGIGLAAVLPGDPVTTPLAYGENQKLFADDPSLLNIQAAQKFVLANGGISINFPAQPCVAPNCTGSQVPYFLWSSKPFISSADNNGQWQSRQLVQSLTSASS